MMVTRQMMSVLRVSDDVSSQPFRDASEERGRIGGDRKRNRLAKDLSPITHR